MLGQTPETFSPTTNPSNTPAESQTGRLCIHGFMGKLS
jgi:hypothetical protein